MLMQAFVNIGAYHRRGSMVVAQATVGSCAQIGANVHLSGGAGIGGVLEPLQAGPVVIEDGAFIGARAEVAEERDRARALMLSMGVYRRRLDQIIDRATGEVFIGKFRPIGRRSGFFPGKPLRRTPGPSLCAPSSSARGQADARGNRHQQTAARLIAFRIIVMASEAENNDRPGSTR